MNTKTKFLALCLLVTLTGSCQDNKQDYKKEIENVFVKSLNSTKSKDFKDMMNYIPDEYFSVYPKEQIISALEREAKNPDTESELKDQKIIKIGDRELIDGKYYSLLTYSKTMKFRYNRKTNNQETEDDYKTRMELSKSLFETKYGQDNVKFDEATYFFEINSEEQAYAIANKGQANWKFISTDEDISILEKILPKQLTDRL